MHENAQLISDFYAAFVRKDGAFMGQCYASTARFSDPVFPDLDARHVRAMWRMFCETPGSDLEVTFRDVDASDARASAHWDARYTFSLTGRTVENSIDASFELENGKIVRHTDRFDFWKWSRMALGAPGVLLGWTPIVRGKVRSQARDRLEKFVQRAGL
jgi:ketosteroid isomerase-like protein